MKKTPTTIPVQAPPASGSTPVPLATENAATLARMRRRARVRRRPVLMAFI